MHLRSVHHGGEPSVLTADPTMMLDPDEALRRMVAAEDTLRAIGAGEVDAFVIAGRGETRRVFTLTTADRPYRKFVESMREGAATLSSAGLILYANRRLAELLGRPLDSIVGSPLAHFIADDDLDTLGVIRGPDGRGTDVEFDLIDDTGAVVPVMVGSSPLQLDDDLLTCLTFTDLKRGNERKIAKIARLSTMQAERMEDLQSAQAALTKQATHDALTVLPNRALLVERIDRELARAVDTRQCVAVFFVDLDHFKQVNDTQGHAAGDEVLRRVAQRLVKALRPIDTVSRIGGDEFAILASEVHTSADALALGNRLVVEMGRPLGRAADGEQVTASIGISLSTGGRGSAEVLLHESDTAMYQAKSLGGQRAELYDAALGRRVERRFHTQRMLQVALDDHRVVNHYQPIVNLASGFIAGFEALARIAEPDGSFLPPSSFIPVAEESGLVVALGEQVLERACREAHSWSTRSPDRKGRRSRERARRTDLDPLAIAVNLSSRQFEPGDLPTIVKRVLDDTGMDPSCLQFELTETTIIDLRPDVLDQLGRIRDLGVQIGLDDFGTGYASLTHLRRIPLSFVKIDQTFVQDLEADGEDARIVSAVIDLASNLGLRSIAEGIETPGQLARLRELGCDEGQGYLFARPLAPADVPSAFGNAPW